MIVRIKRSIRITKRFIVKALSNGGAVFVVVAVLFAGAFAEGVQPVDRFTDLFSGGAPREPADARFGCPTAMRDGSIWVQTISDPDPDSGKVMIECKGGGFVVTWFEASNSFVCLDRNVRPFEECDATEVLSR